MIKIKIFKSYNDKIINDFLEASKGEIMNYNPVVVKYNSENLDISSLYYHNYNSYIANKLSLEYTDLSNIDNFRFIDKSKVHKKNIDIVLLPKLASQSLSFLCDNEVIETNNDMWYCIERNEQPQVHAYDDVGQPIGLMFQINTIVWNESGLNLDKFLLYVDKYLNKMNYE